MEGDRVTEIQVKQKSTASQWIWGAFRMSGSGFRDLRTLWEARGRSDEYFGTLVNSYLGGGGTAFGAKAGEAYVDLGTLHGYRTAMTLLLSRKECGVSRSMPRGAPRSALLEAAALHGGRT